MICAHFYYTHNIYLFRFFITLFRFYESAIRMYTNRDSYINSTNFWSISFIMWTLKSWKFEIWLIINFHNYLDYLPSHFNSYISDHNCIVNNEEIFRKHKNQTFIISTNTYILQRIHSLKNKKSPNGAVNNLNKPKLIVTHSKEYLSNNI